MIKQSVDIIDVSNISKEPTFKVHMGKPNELSDPPTSSTIEAAINNTTENLLNTFEPHITSSIDAVINTFEPPMNNTIETSTTTIETLPAPAQVPVPQRKKPGRKKGVKNKTKRLTRTKTTLKKKTTQPTISQTFKRKTRSHIDIDDYDDDGDEDYNYGKKTDEPLKSKGKRGRPSKADMANKNAVNNNNTNNNMFMNNNTSTFDNNNSNITYNNNSIENTNDIGQLKDMLLTTISTINEFPSDILSNIKKDYIDKLEKQEEVTINNHSAIIHRHFAEKQKDAAELFDKLISLLNHK